MQYLAGIILQYLRSLKNFSEWWTPVFAVLASAVVLWVSPEGRAIHDVRDFINGMVPYILQLLGTTQAVSTASNLAVKAGVGESNPLVPVTDSN